MIVKVTGTNSYAYVIDESD